MFTQERPNIVLILTDQQSATMLSCTGNAYVNTPTLDSIANCGTRFERAYCTNPVCLPSRFSLLTGLMPSTIGLRANHLAGEIPDKIKRQSLGHLVKKAGYEAVYAGKKHLPGMSIEEAGFRTLTDDERDQLATVTANFVSMQQDKPFVLVASFINPHDICYLAIRDFAQADNEQEQTILAKRQRELATLDEALQLPTGVSEDDFFATHCPPLPDNFAPQENEPEAIGHLLASRPFRQKARAEYSDRQWRMHRWAYKRLTEMVDEQISVLWNALREGPHAENTVVIFTSDHGDMDAAHQLEHKTAFYDEAARIPLIISRVGADEYAGVNREHLVSNGLDIVPTICDLIGISPPITCRGKSLRPLIEGQAPTDWRDAVPLENEIGRMIVTDKYKYLRFDAGANAEQLIDLQNDPGEMHNALADSEHQNLLVELRQQFERLHPQSKKTG